MSLRLSALFEEHVSPILADYKAIHGLTDKLTTRGADRQTRLTTDRQTRHAMKRRRRRRSESPSSSTASRYLFFLWFFCGSFGGLVIKLCCLLSALRGKDAYRPEWLQKGSRRPLPCGPPPWDRVFPKNSHSSCWMGKQTRKQQGERGVQHAIPCTPHSPHPPHTAPRAARQPQQVRPLVSVQCRAVQCPGTWQGWIFLYHWFNIYLYTNYYWPLNFKE